ncbi:bifunctional glycosyltransferase family 2 protein/CDP-glycerol:glycerophosphate glycerophosphotransferase [Cytobacillus firmus]|uniref:bifunctional glycosyltransferase/CDP-glycerol:glycerophosphate glycerophosphotransferase n=1 Tax=Cytobacillus firmus TaxID=1399 RepID=UPI00218980D2|nr:bifunctional glycosyltransferase family 2 protein/CDP-glycerol:glycerophosphate glycerophosphotransferase [Cytobacillus firmus]URM33428.1 bifunctional glycosyltransferase family 2 protein/CDP-glycerol:glycerophosphate glycerophosphotransferase [Cytobacillus firmus]
MSKISVIIPIYNTEEFLDASITSAINQTYRDLEIVLVDDGSSETCQKSIDAFAERDSRIVVHRLPKRKGTGAARNLGIEKATGKYLYFLDSDDYLPDHSLKSLIENMGDSSLISGQTMNLNKMNETENNVLIESEVISQTLENAFKNMSVLNRLISADFVHKHGLRFSEATDCYSDLQFLAGLIALLDRSPVLNQCTYYKRTRNDPISNPALMQLDTEKKVTDFLYIFCLLKTEFKAKNDVQKYLDQQFLQFYRRTVVMFFQDRNQIDHHFDSLSNAAQSLNDEVISNGNIFVKSELLALKNKKAMKLKRLLKTHHGLRELKTAFSGRTKLLVFLYRRVFSNMPLKEKTIVFESFLGKNYSDSPKNIYEYMVSKNLDYQYIWIFNEKRKIPGNAKQIKRFSLRYYYYMATAKFWVSNSRIPLHLNKREGNIYLQTWHGTPLKKLVFDMNEIHSANPKYKLHFYQQSRRWDYLISANQYSSEIFRRAFKFEKEMLEFGYPRNDLLHSPQKENKANEIRKKLGISDNKKVILYAPTWRDDEFYKPGQYKFQLKLDLQKMKAQLGDDYVILLRMHYFIADHIDTAGVEDFAFNLSKYDDIAELYLISDILITDYSSVFFDYANLRRPILFFTYDLEKYRDTLRGFYIDMEKELPGPLLKSTDEVLDAIENIESVNKNYKHSYDEFYDKICSWETGNATEMVVKRVFNV